MIPGGFAGRPERPLPVAGTASQFAITAPSGCRSRQGRGTSVPGDPDPPPLPLSSRLPSLAVPHRRSARVSGLTLQGGVSSSERELRWLTPC